MRWRQITWIDIIHPSFCQENVFALPPLTLTVQHDCCFPSVFSRPDERNMKAADQLLQHSSPDSGFLLAACCVPISSLPSKLLFADCLPLCTATGLLDFRISLSLLYVSVCTWDLSVCLWLCLPRSYCLVRVLFSFPLFPGLSISQIP